MRLNLVPFQREFLVSFIQWRKEAATVRHNPLKEMSIEEIEKMLSSEGFALSDLKKFESYRWFVDFNGHIVGNVSLKNISHMMAYAEIGYGMAESHQGKGIGTEAVRLLVEKAFTESSLRKLIAYVDEANIPSCKLLERLGFQREGLLREHYIVNGRPTNEALYGLLKKDWI